MAYNYALIVDEHLESIKRRQTLEQRRSIRENNLEQRALELLREREAKIYLQRSQAIYYETALVGSSSASSSSTGGVHTNSTNAFNDQPAEPPLSQRRHHRRRRKQHIRTELFCMNLEQLELYALSDTAWHGPQKCYEILRQIDHDSPPPQPPQDETSGQYSAFDPSEHYSVLWCRHVNFSVGGDFKLTFRDYTQPLVRMQKWNMWGKLVGAEYTPAFRSKRTVKMGN